jgi:PAS domain S-box-containing protein
LRYRVSWLSPNSESTARESEAGHLSGSGKIVRQARHLSEANIIWRYSLAVLAVAAAAGLRLASHRVLGLQVPYWSFTVAVMVAAWVGGRGPSVAATALSALTATWFFIAPTHSFDIADPASAWGLGLFVITAGPIGLIIVSLQEALLAERENEARFEFVLNAAKLGAWDLDLVSHRVWSAPQHNAIYGYPAAARERTWESYLAQLLPEDRKEIERRFQLAVSTGTDFDYEYRIRRVDGAVRWIWARGRILRYEKGRPVHFSGVTRDITDRKMAEEAVRESEARLQFVLDAANLGAWERDMVNHTVVWRAGHYDALFGYQVPLPEWTWETFLDHVVPEDREELDRKFREFVAAGTNHRWQHEFRIRRADGGVRWMWTEGRVRRDEDGRAVRMFGVKKDITERKQAEERLRQIQKLESIGLLAGGIAHDFNNLLTVIIGNAGFALTKYPSSEEIQQIITASERAAQLTSQLLAYAGKGAVFSKTVNLSDLVLHEGVPSVVEGR